MLACVELCWRRSHLLVLIAGSKRRLLFAGAGFWASYAGLLDKRQSEGTTGIGDHGEKTRECRLRKRQRRPARRMGQADNQHWVCRGKPPAPALSLRHKRLASVHEGDGGLPPVLGRAQQQRADPYGRRRHRRDVLKSIACVCIYFVSNNLYVACPTPSGVAEGEDAVSLFLKFKLSRKFVCLGWPLAWTRRGR